MIGTWLGKPPLLDAERAKDFAVLGLDCDAGRVRQRGEEARLAEGVDASGAVQMDGKPLEMALVNFIPEGETTGPGATGMTDSVGDYSLMHRDANGKMAKGVIPASTR